MTYTRVEMFDTLLGFHLPVQTILMSTVRALIQSTSSFIYDFASRWYNTTLVCELCRLITFYTCIEIYMYSSYCTRQRIYWRVKESSILDRWMQVPFQQICSVQVPKTSLTRNNSTISLYLRKQFVNQCSDVSGIP